MYKDTKPSLVATHIVGQMNQHGPVGCEQNRSTDPPRTTDNAGCGPIHPINTGQCISSYTISTGPVPHIPVITHQFPLQNGFWVFCSRE